MIMSLIKRNNESGLSNRSNYDWFGDDFFDSFWGDSFFPKGMMKTHNTLFPAMNVVEGDKNYKVEIAVPGAKKEDIKIDLDENNVLEVSFSAQKENEQEKEFENGTNRPVKYLCREFSHQSFVKRIALPEEIKCEDIAASFDNGVLEVLIPKREPEVQKIESRSIEIK